MRIRFLVVGGVKGPLAEVIAEYEARAERYWKLEVVEVAAGAKIRNADAVTVKAAEGARLLGGIPERSAVVLLSRSGKAMDSVALATFLAEAGLRSVPAVTFVIGGAFGVSNEVERRADTVLSLAAGTLPHELARLILTEQVYRAGTIQRNEPYHKGGP